MSRGVSLCACWLRKPTLSFPTSVLVQLSARAENTTGVLVGYIVSDLCRYRVVGNQLEKALLMALARFAKDDGSSVYPSKYSLVAELECCLRSVQNAVKSLVQKGILRRVGKRPMFMGGSIIYAIDLDVVATLPNADPALIHIDDAAAEPTLTRAEGVQETTRGSAVGSTKGRRSCTQIKNNPYNQNKQSRGRGDRSGQERRTPLNTAKSLWRKATVDMVHESAPPEAEQAAAAEKVQAMWVEKINAGKYVPPSALTVSQADGLIRAGAVTPRQLDKIGIAFSVPWDRRQA